MQDPYNPISEKDLNISDMSDFSVRIRHRKRGHEKVLTSWVLTGVVTSISVFLLSLLAYLSLENKHYDPQMLKRNWYDEINKL